jgi:hypothetical protein
MYTDAGRNNNPSAVRLPVGLLDKTYFNSYKNAFGIYGDRVLVHLKLYPSGVTLMLVSMHDWSP